MIRLNIPNIKNFLQVVNTCDEYVTMISCDGSRKDINKQYAIQHDLLNEYRKDKSSLRLSLDIPNSTDYMNIVSYYAGDC